jgi:hypothetical protein
LRRTDPAKAAAILSDEGRRYVVALHKDYQSRVFGMDRFSRSGKRPYRSTCGFSWRHSIRPGTCAKI